MKNTTDNIYFVICNYNAQRNGSLIDSLECLSRIKKDNVKILVWDNASSDESVEMLKSYHKKGIIDDLVLSGKNMGKAYALNVLATFVRTTYEANPNDVLISMDSDICIHNDSFAEELLELFSENPKVGFVGFEYYEDSGFDKKSAYHKLVDGVHIRRDINVTIGGVAYHPLSDFGGYLAGALIAMRIGMFSGVNGYSTDLANGGKLAIYGGDDSMIESKLWRSYGQSRMFLFDERPQILHRPDIDEGYAEWKRKCLKSFINDGYHRCFIPKEGYYD